MNKSTFLWVTQDVRLSVSPPAV